MITLRLFANARMTWVLAALIVLYIQTAQLLTNNQSAEVWRCLQISLSFMVIFAYGRQAWGCFQIPDGGWPNKVQLISLGIVLSWGSVFCNGAWGMFWRLSGQPMWMVNNDLYQSWVMFNCIAASLHIIAPNLIGAGVPTIDRVRLGSAFGIAAALVTVITLTRPDLTDWSEAVRPYLESRSGRLWQEMPEPYTRQWRAPPPWVNVG